MEEDSDIDSPIRKLSKPKKKLGVRQSLQQQVELKPLSKKGRNFKSESMAMPVGSLKKMARDKRSVTRETPDPEFESDLSSTRVISPKHKRRK